MRVTAYVDEGGSLILAVSSWAKEPATIRLEIDWDALGLDADALRAVLPAIAGYQTGGRELDLTVPLEVELGGGLLIHVTP